MHFHFPPRQQFKILTLSALVAVLGACTSVEKVGAVATKKVNLAVTLSPPRFVTSPANLIQCVDTTRNLGPDTSTFTSVKFYLGTNTNNPASNPKLLAYGSDLNSRNVPGFSPGSSYVRSNSAALFNLPTPRPTGRQYLMAEIVVGAGDQEVYYLNNVAVVPIDF
ncbi:hypothetical protein LBMAG56_08990 [Verrucomicrobiota bacterium]|nr:hypothetical protein LBMAG56_08990 [Verrucomicrobiota bacterium]